MKRKVKYAFGIDISGTFISLAHLKQDSYGIHLLHAARRPLPEGFMKAGQIDNFKLLKQVIRDLKRRCKQTKLTTLSLSSSRSLMQIMEVPNAVSSNLGQYIQKEIRQYVNLAGVKTVTDYRSLESTGELKRVFVAAGDLKTVSATVNACEAIGLNVQVVEPYLLAYIRSLYHKKVANQFGVNVMFAIIRDDQVCLTVMRERSMRFIRMHDIADVKDTPEALASFLEKKIKMVMQYFEVEVPESSGQWEINVVADEAESLSEQVGTGLREVIPQVSIDVITPENAQNYCTLNLPKDVSQDQISIAAIGYAMRSLSKDVMLPQVNLLPSQIREVKNVRQGIMLTAIAAAVVLLLMGLLSMGLMLKIEKISDRIARKKPNSAVGEVVKKRSDVESQIEIVGRIPTKLKEKIGEKKDVNWPGVLSDINDNKPKGICLTALNTRKNFNLHIKGKALKYSDVTKYVARLSQCRHIVSANLVKTDHKSGYYSHHLYEIKCQLKTTTGI